MTRKWIKWTEKDCLFLKENYLNLTHKEMGLILNRSKSAITAKCFDMNLCTTFPVNIGEKFGRLTVLEKTEKRDMAGKIYFNCLCVCGGTRIVIGSNLRSGNIISCGCYAIERRNETVRFEIGESSFNSYESDYRDGAERRSKPVSYELSREEFRHLVQQKCFYCYLSPQLRNPFYKLDGSRSSNSPKVTEGWAQKQGINVNGIDRVDNNVGYILTNVVPCCTNCNFSKRSLSLHKWFLYIERFKPGFTEEMLIKLEKAGIVIPPKEKP